MWDSTLLIGFPLLALTLCAALLMAGTVRPSATFPIRDLVVVVMIVIAFAFVHVAMDREASVTKTLAMLLASAIVPGILIWVGGARPALYAAALGIGAWMAILLVGSLIAPSRFFVPAYASYQPERSGWFVNPNAYGAAGLVAQCVGLMVWFDRPTQGFEKRGWRIALVPWMVLSGISVLRSASRASLITSLALWLLVLFARRRFFILCALTLIAALTFALVPEILDQLGHVPHFDVLFAKLERPSMSGGRVELWESLVRRTMSVAPLFGLGIGASVDASLDLGFSGTHNAYLKVLVEFGLVGILAFIALLAAVLRKLVQWDHAHAPTKGLAIVFLILLAHSFFESHIFSFGSTPISVLFWQYTMIARTPSERG